MWVFLSLHFSGDSEDVGWGGFSFSVADPSNEDGGNGSNVNNFHINSAWIFMCHDGNREEKDVLPPWNKVL